LRSRDFPFCSVRESRLEFEFGHSGWIEDETRTSSLHSTTIFIFTTKALFALSLFGYRIEAFFSISTIHRICFLCLHRVFWWRNRVETSIKGQKFHPTSIKIETACLDIFSQLHRCYALLKPPSQSLPSQSRARNSLLMVNNSSSKVNKPHSGRCIADSPQA